MDREYVKSLAESADERAISFHREYDIAKTREEYWYKTEDVKKWEKYRKEAAGLLNDFFYWSGKATAYRGVLLLMTEREETCL